MLLFYKVAINLNFILNFRRKSGYYAKGIPLRLRLNGHLIELFYWFNLTPSRVLKVEDSSSPLLKERGGRFSDAGSFGWVRLR
jgi:hypothetical protein